MRADTRQFATNHEDDMASGWKLFIYPQQFLHSQGIRHVVREWREVVQPVCIRNELGVGHVLGDLLIASMEIAYVWGGLSDDFSVQFQNNPQHPMRRRMRWPHI